MESVSAILVVLEKTATWLRSISRHLQAVKRVSYGQRKERGHTSHVAVNGRQE